MQERSEYEFEEVSPARLGCTVPTAKLIAALTWRLVRSHGKSAPSLSFWVVGRNERFDDQRFLGGSVMIRSMGTACQGLSFCRAGCGHQPHPLIISVLGPSARLCGSQHGRKARGDSSIQPCGNCVAHEEKSERSFDASPVKLGGRTGFEHVSAERLCKAQEPC